MKKTILIVLFLLTFASTAFSKVQVPEDERWIYITGNKKQEDTWMDMYTMEFGRSLKSDYHHKEHKFARLWFMRNLYSDDTRFIAFYEFDLQCRTIRRLNLTSYDGNGKVLASVPADYNEESIIPGTVGEMYLAIALAMEKIHDDKEKLNELYRISKEGSDKYRKL